MNLAELVGLATHHHASDIHLTCESPIWMRIGGNLQAFPEYHYDPQNFLSLLNDQQYELWENTQNLDIGYQLENSTRLRINLVQQMRGLNAALRIIPNYIPTLAELPAPKIFQELINIPHGLILVTGPTGSGKSTTLAALVRAIAEGNAKHIITLEDPIEFIHPSCTSLVMQRECHTHFTNYPQALRSALREDPDVILIGELRDLETMQLALTAAETGHLVLSTLHTATAAGSIHRFIDAFSAIQQNMARSLLAECLAAVISQRLINTPTRQAEYEILRATPAVRQLIRDQNISQLITAMQTGAAYGMQTFS